MKKTEISRATLGRIPAYLEYLKALPHDTVNVSATSIAAGLGLGEVQVRKDLGMLCGSGRPKTGYQRIELVYSLEQTIGNQNGETVIVGAGQLGKALLDYEGFDAFGISILAAFDKKILSEEKSGKGKPILPMENLSSFCENHKVKLGIIAVPAPAAQEVCNQLYDCGIRAIWCFASCQLKKPADAVIQYENLALSIAHLKTQMQQA